MLIKDILDGTHNDIEVVSLLKLGKQRDIIKWEHLVKEYDPKNHRVNNAAYRPDKVRDGKSEYVARIYIGLQKLAVRRMTEFVFGIPVKRVYHYDESDKESAKIADALEQIYMHNHINSENIKRGNQFFSSCEICTQWFETESSNALYGFQANKKIRCRTFSPMDGYELYPYFDSFGNMEAMSLEYSVINSGENERKRFFETYTDKMHYIFENEQGGYKLISSEVNPLGKIPFVYVSRDYPIWENTTNIVDEIELTLSRNSDIIAYNAAPVLAVVGTLVGDEDKDEAHRVYQIDQGGNISYVSWSQSTESIKFHVENLMRMFWTQLQLPDISLDNIKGQLVSGEARKTLLTDAHLKVTDESGVFVEYFEREMSVVKAFLKRLQPSWSSKIDAMVVEHCITPFIQNDESAEITKWVNACGGKPVISQLEAIKNLGISNNPEQTMTQIRTEQRDSEESRLRNIFEGGV